MILRKWALLALSAIPAIGQTQPAALIEVRPRSRPLRCVMVR